jgi:hypothetical protein
MITDFTGRGFGSPSNLNHWRGTLIEGSDPYQTVEQDKAARRLDEKIKHNRRAYDLPKHYDVKFTIEPTVGHPLPRFFKIRCPVTSCSRDRKTICVIAADGKETWTAWQ